MSGTSVRMDGLRIFALGSIVTLFGLIITILILYMQWSKDNTSKSITAIFAMSCIEAVLGIVLGALAFYEDRPSAPSYD